MLYELCRPVAHAPCHTALPSYPWPQSPALVLSQDWCAGQKWGGVCVRVGGGLGAALTPLSSPTSHLLVNWGALLQGVPGVLALLTRQPCWDPQPKHRPFMLPPSPEGSQRPQRPWPCGLLCPALLLLIQLCRFPHFFECHPLATALVPLSESLPRGHVAYPPPPPLPLGPARVTSPVSTCLMKE